MKSIMFILFFIMAMSTTTIYGADTRTISLTIHSTTITIDGEARFIDGGGAPFIDNESTLVPLRAIFEALSAAVEWDPLTRTITGRRGSTEIQLTIGSLTAYRNGSALQLETEPRLINDITMVPLRFIAESFGASVEWIPETQSVLIISPIEGTRDYRLFITLGEATIHIGDTNDEVRQLLGPPGRIAPSGYCFYWHVFNSDYSRFIMVGIDENDKVSALFTNARGFSTANASYGETAFQQERNIFLLTDPHANGRVYAGLIMSDHPRVTPFSELGEDFIREQERVIFDLTNTFRVNYGQSVLRWDESAARTARLHSQDMADRDFFSHTGLDGSSPWDRYSRNNGYHRGSGENLFAGSYSGIIAFDRWVDSEGHRENMLAAHHFLGVGFGYNLNSTFSYYFTQFFSRER